MINFAIITRPTTALSLHAEDQMLTLMHSRTLDPGHESGLSVLAWLLENS